MKGGRKGGEGVPANASLHSWSFESKTKSGRTEGWKDGRTEGRTKGRTEGRTIGKEEGRKDGRTEGKQRMISRRKEGR